jgi:hypothetical protein
MKTKDIGILLTRIRLNKEHGNKGHRNPSIRLFLSSLVGQMQSDNKKIVGLFFR